MNLFNIENKTIVITGAVGVLGSEMSRYLLQNGATVIILHYKEEPVLLAIENLKKISSKVDGYICNVLDEASLQEACVKIIEKHHQIDVLINAAGGNMPGATIAVDQNIFDVKIDDFKKVVDLNLFGSVLPSLIFGKEMAKNKQGIIINISSMTAQSAVSRVVGYSASKAAIDNFTKWLSVELALKFGEGLRVNALAPGFFIGNQNRDLLIDKQTGTYTDRGNSIIQNTPMKRFGNVEELNGAIHFLCSEASKFVTGVVIPVDGGFSAYIENYKRSIENLAQSGIKIICYNFMPVLDWTRTSLDYELEDGSKALRFDKTAFASFELYLLKRPDAEKSYSELEIKEATAYFKTLSEAEKNQLTKNIIAGLPGAEEGYTLEKFQAILHTYKAINAQKLKENLVFFLKQITPTATQNGVLMCLHPDDPPYPILGLPRVASTEADYAYLFQQVPALSNGITFCTGSLGVRPDNDLVQLFKKFADRVHFLHLRSTKRDDKGNFYEANHLEGDVDMFSVVREVLLEEKKKKINW
ncbi:mannonate dehydratase [Flavobacterium sp. F-392]|uniref:Mannonate dehydratase n=1 Tax=Flavobacterium muglaense TaxID=2764716 RepID=A0A923MWT3_9FLAO|nr:mannonate dehydratase [Flavobacterium muglaense]MBC5842972.1 mannonate dehydratase [Flavobacterium muglaense]